MSGQDNQTQFSQVQPLYESPVDLPVTAELKNMRQKRKKILILVGGGFVLLLGLTWTLSIFLTQTPQSQLPATVTPPTPTPVPDTSLRGRIESAQKELQFIGQTEYQLPLPQVDWNIRLEDKPQ